MCVADARADLWWSAEKTGSASARTAPRPAPGRSRELVRKRETANSTVTPPPPPRARAAAPAQHKLMTKTYKHSKTPSALLYNTLCEFRKLDEI